MKSMYRRTSTTTLWHRTNQWKREIYQDKATRFYYAYTQKTGMLISALSFGGGMDSSEPITAKEEKRREWRLFLLIVDVLFPIMSVLKISGFGFSIWMSQIFAVPPTIG